MAIIATTGAGIALINGFLIVDSNEFLKFLSMSNGERIVVLAVKNTGIVHKEKTYIYATVYGGFLLLTKTNTPLPLPSNTKTVKVEEIFLPQAIWD